MDDVRFLKGNEVLATIEMNKEARMRPYSENKLDRYIGLITNNNLFYMVRHPFDVDVKLQVHKQGDSILVDGIGSIEVDNVPFPLDGMENVVDRLVSEGDDYVLSLGRKMISLGGLVKTGDYSVNMRKLEEFRPGTVSAMKAIGEKVGITEDEDKKVIGLVNEYTVEQMNAFFGSLSTEAQDALGVVKVDEFYRVVNLTFAACTLYRREESVLERVSRKMRKASEDEVMSGRQPPTRMIVRRPSP